MLPVFAFLLGFAVGWQRARARGGDRLDQLQYGTVHGIFFVIVSIVGLIILEHLTVA